MKAKTQIGVVRNLRRGDEGSTSNIAQAGKRDQILSFRLELTDATGDITGYLQVEMRGENIAGDVAEGDRVEVEVHKVRDGIVATKSFQNLTTHSRVYVRGRSIFAFITFAIFLIVFFTILYFILSGWIDVNHAIKTFERVHPQ